MVYRDWPALLPQTEVWLVHLPGRTTRFAEPPIATMDALVAALSEAFTPHAHGRFGFFGHSMGARVAFELTRSLRQRALAQPRVLHLSACGAPHLPPRVPTLHSLPQSELVSSLQQRGGLPDAIVKNEELLGLVLPVVRTDLKLFETAPYVPQRPLAIPFVLYGGRADSLVSAEMLTAWQRHTSAATTTHWFEGEHFFISEQQAAVISAVAQETEAIFGSRP